EEDEASEVGRRYREAPLDAEAAVGREPEEGETPGLGEAFSELAWPGGEIAGQRGQERVHGEGGDGLPRQRQDQRWHENVESEHPEGNRDEEPGAGAHRPPDSSTCSNDRHTRPRAPGGELRVSRCFAGGGEGSMTRRAGRSNPLFLLLVLDFQRRYHRGKSPRWPSTVRQ